MARGKLTKFAATKPAADPAPAETHREETTTPEKGPTKAMTLRLNKDAWRQLRLLAFDDGRTAHALLIDAMNDYFQKRGKPPLA